VKSLVPIRPACMWPEVIRHNADCQATFVFQLEDGTEKRATADFCWQHLADFQELTDQVQAGILIGHLQRDPNIPKGSIAEIDYWMGHGWVCAECFETGKTSHDDGIWEVHVPPMHPPPPGTACDGCGKVLA
jgi:hypothetical protein